MVSRICQIGGHFYLNCGALLVKLWGVLGQIVGHCCLNCGACLVKLWDVVGQIVARFPRSKTPMIKNLGWVVPKKRSVLTMETRRTHQSGGVVNPILIPNKTISNTLNKKNTKIEYWLKLWCLR